jgi:type IV fimbrial biogenesis protein FimT
MRSGLNTRRWRAAGFTIVELMVGVAIVAILAAIATPAMRAVVTNGRVRTAGQSVQNGLALARAEAVRLNTQVEFVFTPNGWTVQRVASGEVLHTASGQEATRKLKVTVQPAGADRITFDNFGRAFASNPIDGSARMTQIDLEADVEDPSEYRQLRVQLLSGGMSRLCDPKPEARESSACL